MFGIYRSRDRLIAGVAAGVADRLGVDRRLVRLVWLISIPFTWFTSAIVYAIAAVVLPVADRSERPRRSSFAPQALALFVAAHGAVHLIGFLTPWRLPVPQGFVYSTSIFFGRIELTDAGVKALGIVWLAVAAAYVVTAALLWLGARHAVMATVLVSAVSAPLCALYSPEAVAGLAIDLALIVGLLVVARSRVAREAFAR